MFAPWYEFDRRPSVVDEMRRRMDRMFNDFHAADVSRSGDTPRAALFDAGTELVLRVEVPGFTEEELDLTVHRDVVTLRGERKVGAPEGYQTHRQERRTARFARSFKLSTEVDSEQTAAKLSDGLLEIRLAKTPDSQPRKIQVSA